MTLLMSGAGLMAFISTWGSYAMHIYYMIAAVITGACASILVYQQENRFPRIRIILPVLPLLAAIIPAGLSGCLRGAGIWINVIIYNWNQIHEDGIALLSVSGGQMDVLSFVLFVSVVTGESAAFFIYSRSAMKSMLYILFWIIIQLISGNSDILSFGILIACGIIVNIAGKTFYITLRSSVISAVIFAIFIAMSLSGNRQIEAVSRFRSNISKEVDNIRYGEDNLPSGDIKKADTLLSDTEDMLTVWSEQEKNIYLKGFVGSRYDTTQSEWKTLSNASYGGDNRGMLEWLNDNGISPQNQSARYYELSNKTDKPQANRLRISIANASRKNAYVPSSVDTFVRGNVKNNKDTGYICKGLTGADEYEVSEISDIRPSELIIADEWLESPETEEQKSYIEAEDVYREFVYDNYTEETSDYYELMNKLFWEDYEPVGDGIYEAVVRVRSVLKDNLTYTEHLESAPYDAGDTLMWYITEAKEGNAVIYASTAVQALRTHGIPARYVEGYYVAASELKSGDKSGVTVTGKNSHAWVEVYFDGIGWQPVDVTPGYYYEAATLQKMVSSPGDIHKTAAFDSNNSQDMGKVVDNTDSNTHKAENIMHKAVRKSAVVLGILAVICIIIAIVLSAIEIVYHFVYAHQKRIYINGSSSDKAIIIQKRLYQLLSIKGIDATLGWHTKEVDRIISDSVKNIEPGDYTRASVLLEKVLYGGCELEPYELRTLEIFVDEMFKDHAKESGLAGFKARHIAFGNRRLG